MMLSAVSLAVVVVLVVASTEDCPLHCPPAESPVCGTGEPKSGQSPSQN